MLKQCAGCGKVFDDESGKSDVQPRPYGCCEECNAASFRTHADKEVLPPPPPNSGLIAPEVAVAPEEPSVLDEMHEAQKDA